MKSLKESTKPSASPILVASVTKEFVRLQQTDWLQIFIHACAACMLKGKKERSLYVLARKEHGKIPGADFTASDLSS